MAKAEYPLRHSGWADKKLKWKTLSDIFDEVWGSNSRSLPTYPKVLGGVRASWINRSEIKFIAESMEEIHKEYLKGTIKQIEIVGKLDGTPHAILIFRPDEGYIIFEITSDKYEISDSAISLVKKYFPITSKDDKQPAIQVEKPVMKEKENWHQKWWGQIIVGLVYTVLGSLFVTLILWIISYLL